MNIRITASDKKHLLSLILENIELNGKNCNLNHIDTSRITDMSWLFHNKDCNVDISQWDVSNVIDMKGMFQKSTFNGCLLYTSPSPRDS